MIPQRSTIVKDGRAAPVGFESGHRLSARGGGLHLIWFLGAARDGLSGGALGKFVEFPDHHGTARRFPSQKREDRRNAAVEIFSLFL